MYNWEYYSYKICSTLRIHHLIFNNKKIRKYQNIDHYSQIMERYSTYLNSSIYKDLFNLYQKHPFTIKQNEKNAFDFDCIGITPPHYFINTDKIKCYLNHITDLTSILSILEHNKMYGSDANQGTHFNVSDDKAIATYNKGAVMFFEWNGPQQFAGSGEYEKQIPDVLTFVSPLTSLSGYSKQHTYFGFNCWETRLYPGTNKGLSLLGFSFTYSNETFTITFHNPVDSIEIVKHQDFRNHLKTLERTRYIEI